MKKLKDIQKMVLDFRKEFYKRVQDFIDKIFNESIEKLKSKHEPGSRKTIHKIIDGYFHELKRVLQKEHEEQHHHKGKHILSDTVNEHLEKDKTNIWLHAVHDTLNK